MLTKTKKKNDSSANKKKEKKNEEQSASLDLVVKDDSSVDASKSNTNKKKASSTEKVNKKDIRLATAMSANFRSSIQKLRFFAKSITGLKAQDALRRVKIVKNGNAEVIYDVLKASIANAEHNMRMNRDTLIIKKVDLMQKPYLKRWTPKARGRSAAYRRPYSAIRIILVEQMRMEDLLPRKNKKKKV